MAKDPDAQAMSEDSISYLEEVKKGKPRKFAMICKGTSVVSLVVYKKGNVEKRKKEAKEAGKGQFYFGVVDGKGVNIRFVLSRADGFESAPVKTASLKNFLDESADFSCKPIFEIVDAAPLVLDEDDPLVARFLKLQEAAFRACEAFPDRASEINELCLVIGRQLDQEQSDEASGNLDKLESLLRALQDPKSSTAAPAIQPQPSTTAEPATQSVTADDALKAKLQDALNKLVPQLKQAVAANPARKVELLTPVAAIKKQMDAGDLQAARQGILAVGQLLKSVLTGGGQTATQPGTQPQPVDPLQAEYDRKLAELQPSYEKALRELIGDTSKFRTVMTYATEQAGAGAFGNAIKAIDRLQIAVKTAIDASASATVSGVSIQKLGKARIEFGQLRESAIGQLEDIKEEIKSEYSSDEEQAGALVGAIKRLDELIAALDKELIDRLDEVLNASEEGRGPLVEVARKVVGRFQSFLESDVVASQVDGNEFIPETNAIEPMRAKLDEIVEALGL